MKRTLTTHDLRDPMPLPCPFCGAPPTYYDEGNKTAPGHYLQCDNYDCYTLTQSYFCMSYEQAVERWNHRDTLEQSLIAALEELEHDSNELASIQIYSDCSGRIQHGDAKVAHFENFAELFALLKGCDLDSAREAT